MPHRRAASLAGTHASLSQEYHGHDSSVRVGPTERLAGIHIYNGRNS